MGVIHLPVSFKIASQALGYGNLNKDFPVPMKKGHGRHNQRPMDILTETGNSEIFSIPWCHHVTKFVPYVIRDHHLKAWTMDYVDYFSCFTRE